jgi:NADH:ubiquinone oxidoreductase subunit F (NADH-binding)/(2Fe-2S) ferredoxin/Pyruvate/2-oxoacid:ferredoxin oxidoreductase delta subunit
MSKITHPQQLDEWKKDILSHRPTASKTVVISSGTCGQASGSLPIIEAFRSELASRGLEETYELLITGCHGPCQFEPNIIILPERIFYKNLKPGDVPEIIEKTLVGGRVISRLVYEDKDSKTAYSIQEEIPFYSKQLRLLTENNAKMDPTRIEDYIAVDGYKALARALFDMTAEEAIAEISESGLRGRGGAGFPTGKKWEICRSVRSDIKYIICNADEGDPGAYMDRSLLEGNPHSVIEGMIIGAYAIGAQEGYIYVRTEYPLAVKHINMAIEQAKEHRLLGGSIMGSEFNFDLHVIQGAGAFVSGEETSLMASIEGQRAFPRQKPPFPAEAGLWGHPTNINNVETWANVPLILRKGAEWYSQIGTRNSKGTKIFSLVGKIRNTGLVEVPMGVTLREIIYDIGGGIPDGKKFKAIQTGGPSGGCMPAELLDLQIDYDSLKKAGSMMGSGGMIVMDEDTCMVDVARYFLEFTQEESCGKCVPCRLGTRQLVDILTRITQGKGEEGDIKKLKDLAKTINQGALCGLGQTAPNPVLTTLKYFEDEYQTHIKDKACPACVCKELMIFHILPDKCVGCLLCKNSCPVGAISGERKEVHVIDQDKCIKCGICFDVCPPKIMAVAKLTGAKKDKILKKSSGKSTKREQ